MTRAPTSQAERYLDAARTLGVSDAALRRHLAVGADASLQAELADRLTAATDELLELLAAAGVVLDLDAVDPDETEALRCCLARFGFAAECAAVAGELEVVAADLVADDVRHVRVEPTADELRSALRERLFDDVDVRVVPLVDDRVLVAETRSLATLQNRYGDRLEVFETPLLATDALAVAPDAAEAVDGATTDAAASAGDDSDAGGSRRASGTDRADLLVDEETSFGDVLAAADDETTAAIESALEEGGPRVHTADAEDAGATEAEAAAGASDARQSDVGGGPRRTVSSSGIDQVFEELEASADAGGGAGGAVAASASSEQSSVAGPESDSDAADDEPAADGDSDDGIVGGGPTRTVSETSADDILERVAGDEDFEDIADEQGEADPEAVLNDAEEVPGVDDGNDVGSTGESDAEEHGDVAKPGDDGDTDESGGAADASEDDATPPDLAGRVEDALDAATDDAPNADESADANEPDNAADATSGAISADEPANADGAVHDGDESDGAASDEATGDATADAAPDVTAQGDRAPSGGPELAASDADDVEDAADALASTAVGDRPAPVDDESDADLSVAEDVLGSDRADDAASDEGDDAAVDQDAADTTEEIDGSTSGDIDELSDDADQSGSASADSPSDTTRSDGVDAGDAGDADNDSSGLGDALVGDDVEVRRGTETVATGADAVDVDRGANAGRPSTDGPLARTGGVSTSPSDDASSQSGDVGGDGSESDDEDGSPSLLERVRSVFRR